MAVDISTQLRAIASQESGETVLSNIGSAVEVLNETYEADIVQELQTIYGGTYGRDIRQAIYDALFKLSIASPGGGGGVSPIVGVSVLYNRGYIVKPADTVTGISVKITGGE